jgi:hypothetical protein
MDAKNPNWADITTAISTAVLALGVIIALLQLADARRAARARSMLQVSKKWNDPAFQQVRTKVRALVASGRDKFSDNLLELRDKNATEYEELLEEPYYFDELAILVKYGALTFSAVDALLGPTVFAYWCRWTPFVEALRSLHGNPHLYENFERLANRIAKNGGWG